MQHRDRARRPRGEDRTLSSSLRRARAGDSAVGSSRGLAAGRREARPVRALMEERGLDAIVARTPDNVLYLTNFWGMKGYDACVFPREGDPALVCLEASEEDAARTAWTSDVRLFRGYHPDDPRPPLTRVLEVARAACAEYETRGPRALTRNAGGRSHGGRADDVHARLVHGVRAGRRGRDAVLAAARAVKTEQEIERMRLANEIAAAAMEHCRLVIEPGMTEAEIAAEWEGFVHGEGTGWKGRSSSRSGSRSSGRARGSRRSPPPRAGPSSKASRRCSRSGCAWTATGATTRRTSSSASSPRSTGSSRSGSRPCTAARWRSRPGASLAELDRLVRAGIDEIGFPGQPSHPICHGVGARAHEPPYAHQAGGGEIAAGMVLAIEPGCYMDGRRRAARRGQLPRHGERRGEAFAVPGRDRRRAMTIDRSKVWTGDVNARALEPQPKLTVGLYDTTLRDGEQTVGVVLSPERQARDRDRALGGRRGPDRGGLSACVGGRLALDRAHPRGRPRGGDLGLLARRPGRRRGARRARPEGVGHREPDLGREARGARRVARRR